MGLVIILQVFDLGSGGEEHARRVADVADAADAASRAPFGGSQVFHSSREKSGCAIKFIAPIGNAQNSIV